MNPEVKRAAEEYALTIWSKELATYDEKQDCANAFLAGAEYGFARAVNLLRGDGFDEAADWLESQNHSK